MYATLSLGYGNIYHLGSRLKLFLQTCIFPYHWINFNRLKIMCDIDKLTLVAYMSSLPYLICWHYFVEPLSSAAILHLHTTFILLFEVVLQEKCVCESEVIWTENPSLSRDWLKTSEIFELTRLSPLGLTATSHASFFIQSNEKETSSYWAVSSTTFALKCYQDHI